MQRVAQSRGVTSGALHSTLHPPLSTSSASFTLIELLVVVAIIALLVSILLPSLNNARAQSKAAVCMSNLRQQGLALRMYADDHPKGQLPSQWEYGAAVSYQWNVEKNKGGVGSDSWFGGPHPYFRCPAQPYNPAMDEGWQSYGLNYITVFSNPHWPRKYRESRVLDFLPTSTYMVARKSRLGHIYRHL